MMPSLTHHHKHFGTQTFGEMGMYTQRQLVIQLLGQSQHPVQLTLNETIDHINYELHLFDAIDPLHQQLHVYGHGIMCKKPDYEALCKNFAYVPLDSVKRTFTASTQFARNV